MKNIQSVGLRSPVWIIVAVAASLALPASGRAAETVAAPQRLKGMLQQIEVRKAAALVVSAPKGEYVAVLDQSAPARDPKLSKAQDHNNGWLQLLSGQAEGGAIKVKGKYYVPATTQNRPTALRLTVRKQTKVGFPIYADKSLKIAAAEFGRWTEFEIELPLTGTEPPTDGNFILMLSAVPLAGPVYLDELAVTDAAGRQLWAYPSFE